MNKEELIELKRKIESLSNEDKKKRDLYLKGLSDGTIEGPLTGYASIDKPWLKYYSDEAICKDFDPMSVYQLMEKSNLGHENEIAIEYFGKKITYGELLKNIDKVAKSLIANGVKKGDVVMMSMPNTPEAEYLFYAINKIGATVNSIDPRSSSDAIYSDIKSNNIKYVFILDVIYEKIADKLNDEMIEKIITISPVESLPIFVKAISSLKNKGEKVKNDKLIKWNEFLKQCKNIKGSIESVYNEHSIAAIVHTGGSTGTPKSVALSNEAFNSLIYQFKNSNMGFKRGKKYLNILPPFIALGLDNSMHLAACMGLESIMIPSFEPEQFPDLVLKYKPNMLMGGPIHYSMIMNSPKMKKEDLSFLEIIVSGGDKMPLETQQKIQNFLKQHNVKTNLWLGYGATEVSSGISCVKDDCFRLESVGAPYLQNVLKVTNPDTGDEICGYGATGELLINAPTLMNGYIGDHSEETKQVIVEDEVGNKWYKTGDIAHLDSDGMVYIDGRIKRIITRRGFKIYPLHIEELILSNEMVKECAVVGISDPVELNVPVANVVLKPEYNNEENKKKVIEYVNNLIMDTLPDYSVLAGYNFLEELPLTNIGKIDFKTLEKIGLINEEEKAYQKTFKI